MVIMITGQRWGLVAKSDLEGRKELAEIAFVARKIQDCRDSACYEQLLEL